MAVCLEEEAERWREEAPEAGVAAFDSYEEYRTALEGLTEALREQGREPVPVRVGIDEFHSWRQNRPARSLAAYAAERLRQSDRGGEPEEGGFAVRSTDALIEALATCGLRVPQGLAEELVRRSDATNGLVDLVRLAKYWSPRGPGERWTPIHALHLLSARGTGAGLAAAEEVLRYQPDDLGDWLPEVVPSLLFAYGMDARPVLQRLLQDPSLDTLARLAAAEALAALARFHPRILPEVKELFFRVAREDEDVALVTFLANELAEFRDPRLRGELKALLASRRTDPSILDWETLEQIYSGELPPRWGRTLEDPMHHFNPENLRWLRKLHDRREDWKPEAVGRRDPTLPKVGRNKPCPCGSGKKYKKCHGRP